MSIAARIQEWLEGPFDPQVKEELRRLMQTDPKSLEDAFFKDLSFGTGGMRGIMGLGTNRLNIYTIRMATQGLANYIKKQPGAHSVFIGYDTRLHSREFAEETAKVFSGNGIRALLSQDICPTPLVSFACRHLKCTAAVMITASHNPPQYNGYKVYWSDGGQVVPPHDVGIMKEVEKIKTPAQVQLGKGYEEVGSEIDAAYLAQLKKYQLVPKAAHTPLKIIYTNLHGTGIRLLPKALQSWGFKAPHLVKEQSALDGHFPNAPSPNPEEAKALALGMKQLEEEQADILIATDPDADRLGLASGKTRFNGNQIACLCLYHLCKNKKKGALLKSIVTTELLKKMVESFGGTCIDVLTGFKYIGEKISLWETSHEHSFLFGAEESYGYLFVPFVRDKDAISTACLIAEMASLAKSEGKSLEDVLEEIYKKYGIYREMLVSLTFSESQEGMRQMQEMMRNLRKKPPHTISGQKVERMEDFLPGLNALPPSDVLRFWLQDGTKLVIRPSGTEPKVKIYAEAVGKVGETLGAVDERLKKEMADFQTCLGHRG